MVKKSKNPKYCENSNMIIGIIEYDYKCKFIIFSYQLITLNF